MIVIPFYLQLVDYIQAAVSTWESNIGTLSNWLCCHREIAQLLVEGDDLCNKLIRGQEALKTTCIKKIKLPESLIGIENGLFLC